MTNFAYRAVHKTGKIHKGHIDAANENELCRQLRQLDLELIEAKARTATRLPKSKGTTRKSISSDSVIHMTSQLADLLSSGVPVVQAMKSLIEVMQPAPLRDCLINMTRDIEAGATVTAAFSAHPRIFSRLFLTLLAAGEQCGDLANSFVRLKKQLLWQQDMNREIAHALRYPLFLVALASSVTGFMMMYVVPQMIDFLLSLGTDLPFSTRLLIGFANLFSVIWWAFPSLALIMAVFLIADRRISPVLALWVDTLILRLPLAGSLLRDFMLARFCTSFAVLVKSGHSIPDALSVARDTVSNIALAKTLSNAAMNVSSGQSLSVALTSVLSPFATQMLKVGEMSGRLVPALEDIAHVTQRDAREKTSHLLGILEPALTLLVGLLLAWVVLAVLGPVYGSLGLLSRGM